VRTGRRPDPDVLRNLPALHWSSGYRLPARFFEVLAPPGSSSVGTERGGLHASGPSPVCV
jgi:hypothetical protein